jgi:YegS/Rv2252/BmrU family lipid kinase
MKLFKTHIIVNPASAKGQTRRRWTQMKDGIRRYIREFKVEFTEKPMQAIEMARTALRDGSDLVIGVGGDGTMNEIANGFYENARLINPEATLGIVPSGSGCDLTKSLRIPPRFRDAMQVITEAPTQAIDVGRVSYRDGAGERAERIFLNVADFGVGGEVVHKVNTRRLERRASSYVRCLVETMAHYRAKRVRVRVDGVELPHGEYLIGAVANGRIFGKGMKIAPDARLDDGLFDTVLVKSMRFVEFCLQGWKLMNGSHVGYRKVEVVRGSRVEADPEDGEPVLLEFDGEQLGTLPAAFSIQPRSLPIKGYL